MTNHFKVKEFYLEDYEATLFPMETCRLLVERSNESLSSYIEKISNPKEKDFCFLPQETVYACKAKHHLRRTMKLDPVAEYFLYEMTYKNRKIFRKSRSERRENFGYRFFEGKPIPIHQSYSDFVSRAKELKLKFDYFIKFDISAYFNSIYHHDITNWFSSQKPTQSDMEMFGRFMREINSGFSIDFLPHGIYPSKMLGSHFLSFMDDSELLRCEHLIRFMDDYMIFSDSKDTLIRDFQVIQKGLGQKSLNINSDKTVLFCDGPALIEEKVDEIKKGIKEKIYIGSGSGMDQEDYVESVRELSKEETDYLISLMDEDLATDYEASLILDCIHEHGDNFVQYVPDFIYKFPHLAKRVFHKCSSVEDKERLSDGLIELVKDSQTLNEHQLFWIAKIVESYLLSASAVGNLLALLYEHKDATNISKAKILEIPELRFGMPEWREVHLKNGSSGWLAWASAVGMRNDTKQARNYLMGYFSKVSPINKLIGDCIVSL